MRNNIVTHRSCNNCHPAPPTVSTVCPPIVVSRMLALCLSGCNVLSLLLLLVVVLVVLWLLWCLWLLLLFPDVHCDACCMLDSMINVVVV